MRISLERAIAAFRHEAGGHRIQRVPRSEKAGRVHSSTVTVSVLEDVASNSFVMDDRNLRMRWFSGTGKGGQHRNRHQNCVELIHVPTGISKTAQTRSRETSLAEARRALESELSRHHLAGTHSRKNSTRVMQIGGGERSDKRRTLRFQDDRVTDHVTGRSTSLARYLKGHVDDLWPEG